MMDLMRAMNGNLEDKLNNRKSGVFEVQIVALQTYPSLGNYSEYFFTDPRVLKNSYVDKCDSPEVLIQMVQEYVKENSANMSMTK